ncbi:MAG TPA: sulfatase [Gaiellales bacterium]|nr:sulfatase [Gaiellales bacterium]
MNVLWVIVDCLRADMLARPRAEWPVASRLAEEGTAFTACYSTCPTTTPAFTSMFTGRYPTSHGVRGLRGTRLAETMPTVAERLSAAGHATWCSVTGPLLQTVGTVRGFEEIEYREAGDRSVHSGFGARAVAQVERLEAGGRPYLAVLHVWDVHMPRRYPASFDRRRYGRDAYERAFAGVDSWLRTLLAAAGDSTLVVFTGDHGENTRLEPRTLRTQELHRRAVRRLPVIPWAQWTLHRGARSDSKRLLHLAPRHLWGHGQTLFEPLVRVPLVFRGPGVAGGERRTPVSHVDLAPTILELAGAEAGGGWQGQSLAGAIRGGAEPAARPVAMEIAGEPKMPPVRQRAIRVGRHKLITSFDDARWVEALYDLETDPGERRNLARRMPDVADDLRAKLRALLAEEAETVAIAGDEDAEIADRLRELGYL